MTRSPRSRSRRGGWVVAALALALILPGTDLRSGGKEQKETLRFAARMAKQGNWREAQYRWERVREKAPKNAFLLNNLAVASEVLGDYEDARRLYEDALALTDDARIRENARRQQEFAEAIKEESGSFISGGRAGFDGDKTKGPKPLRVGIRLPLPPRLDLSGVETLLVASFLGNAGELFDTDKEMVRFMRSEFRKGSRLDVLDVTPAPAIPEQRLEDLIANSEFWKYLGSEHGADLIVSGAISFNRRDASGFKDVDTVSNVTGQKVRQTRFVEQEQFSYRLELLFFDGETGELRFRDTLSRSVVFVGLGNDSLTAFHELSARIAADVLAVVSSRSREDLRVIFEG